MKKLIKHSKNLAKKSTVAIGFAAMSSVAFAEDHTATIQAAYADGNTNVTAVVVGLIGLVAITVGIGAMMGLFKRG